CARREGRVMTTEPHAAVAWVYRGLWGILARWFRVPRQAPTLPFHDSAAVESFRPAEAYLRYLKFFFWLSLIPIVGGPTVVLIIAAIAAPIVGAVLALPLILLMAIPPLAGYIALHLRYDTTWYVLTDRSMRVRRGIWTIRETTITFENIQNVVVRQ